MKTVSGSPKPTEDDEIDHVGVEEWHAMCKAVGQFLVGREDIRVSLARHKYRGGWFILMSSNVGLGQLQSDMPKETSHGQMLQHLHLLHGRMATASTQAARPVRKAIERHVEEQAAEDNWEDW